MKSLQRKHEIIDVGHAVSFAAQPAYELKPELRREAAQVAEPHLLQEVTSVAPEHHVDVHVLCTLPITTVGTEFRRDGDIWMLQLHKWKHKSASSPCWCVCVPFSRGSRRHTEGLLEVELARIDGVCRL